MNMKVSRMLIHFAVAVAGACIAGQLAAAAAQSAEQAYASDIASLASDDMGGRGLGTDGIGRAATWLEERLSAMGLVPAFDGGYRQPFPVKTGVTMKGVNQVEGLAEDDWVPFGFSSSGEFSGELVFAGYGISADPLGYNELEDLDLDGKVALVLRYEPQERDNDSIFAGRMPSRWSALRYKVLQLRERGAAAVVFATGPLQDEGNDRLPVLRNDGPESPAGLPVIQVRTSIAQRWLESADIDLATFQAETDRDLQPRSQRLEGVRVSGTVTLEADYEKTDNLAGLIPGKGALADEYVVIGAHYDHLGMGGASSMRPNEEAIHNGADDNASGTIAVLHAADRLQRELAASDNHRTVVIALFSAEETGLAGSSFLVDNPPFPVDQVVAMLNLDMVGRLRDNTLVALGSESADEWAPALEQVAAKQGLEITQRGDGYGPSDQTSFYARQIPVLHFFTGAHEEYHSPEDDAATINAAGAVKVIGVTAEIGRQLAIGQLNPGYRQAAAAPAMGGDSRGYGAYLGTVPDYRAMEASEGGVLLGDVRPGGPADLAGIRGGDTIVRMAGTTIENLMDMTYALQDNKPGDTIDVVILRSGERLTLRATLGDRALMSKSPTGSEDKPQQAASPHGQAAPAVAAAKEEDESFTLPAFYQGRPGPDFEIGAGRVFEKSIPDERHFADIRQLTFGGENAEAYFSPDGTKIIYQATTEAGGCDQQYVLDLVSGESRLVSSGKGRTTCGYYDWPEADRIIFASTESGGDACPAPPDYSMGYVWALYEDFDLYEVAPDGTGQRRLTDSPGYDAEATWCHRGGEFVFTSTRDGDLELYAMDEDGNVRRLTDQLGYDGGAFYSPDCKEIVWRASRPQGEALADYQRLLGQGLIRPSALDLFIMDADGSNQRQLTDNGAANFGPYFHPDGRRIIYSSNAGTANDREFELFLIDKVTGETEQVTFSEGFDGFPQFSPDGEWFVWASNRANPGGRSTNLFIARWRDEPGAASEGSD
jgi:Tol biopolymer transport system component